MPGFVENIIIYVYPVCDTAYFFDQMYDSNGFYIINITQNLSEKNIFKESVRYPKNLTAEKFTVEVERWLKKSAGITFIKRS